jgi:dihydropteroate synthase
MREVSRGYPLPVSVDTTKPEVAERSLEAGASMINDVNGLRQDARLADLAARTGAALILMHMRGTPRTMQRAPSYRDVTVEVAASLRSSVEVARTHHVPDEQLLVDPGIGFGKTAAHNYTILRELPELARIGLPILVGASRKAFLGKPQGLPVSDRLEASIAAHVAAVLAGAHMVRVHDVRATVRAVRIADEILRAAP